MRLLITVSLLLCALAAPRAAEPDCAPGRYHKSLLVTGFRLSEPQDARVGRLNEVETRLPQALARQLAEAALVVQSQTDLLLESDNRLLNHHYERFDAVQHAARQYQTQYVLTGRIVDMAMRYPERYYGATALTHLGNWFKSPDQDRRQRHFALRLALHDAITGRLMGEYDYSAAGLWDAPYGRATGFATPRFWETDYGRAVQRSLTQAVADIRRDLGCAPFRAPLKTAYEEGVVYLQAGARQGIRPGDRLTVARRSVANFASLEYHSTRTLAPEAYHRIDPTDAKLTIEQVHADYSVGRFSGPLPPHRAYLAVDHTPAATTAPEPEPAAQPEMPEQDAETTDRPVPPR